MRRTAQRTWESTMTWRPLDIGGMSIFTTRFLPMVETLGLASPPEWKIPETGPVEDGSRRHHYRAPSGTLYLESPIRRGPPDLIVLRHVGASPAEIVVSDLAGTLVRRHSLPATGEPLQYARVSLRSPGTYRIELKSTETRAWDLITAHATRRVSRPRMAGTWRP